MVLIMSEKLPALTDELKPVPKKRGRKPGGGKVPGSGRKPGGKNIVSADMRSVILARGKPLELLCDISRGVKIRVGPQAGPAAPAYAYPSLQERAAAAKILLDKLMPTASTTEITGKDGAPLLPEKDTRQTAQALAFILSKDMKERGLSMPKPPRRPDEARSPSHVPAPSPPPEIAPSESTEANSRWVDPSRLLHPSQCDDPPLPKVLRFRPKGMP
jgi:hypothetical protein